MPNPDRDKFILGNHLSARQQKLCPTQVGLMQPRLLIFKGLPETELLPCCMSYGNPVKEIGKKTNAQLPSRSH